MIEAVCGKIGGGKTYSSVVRMLRYVATGGRVWSNITLDRDRCAAWLKNRYGWILQEGQLNALTGDDLEGGFFRVVPEGLPDSRNLIVIDEVNEWFDSLDLGKLKTDSLYREVFRFFRQSRKVYCDVLLILQDLGTLNARLRGLIQYNWRCTDMRGMRLPMTPIRWPFSQILLQRFQGEGRYLVDRHWLWIDKAIWACYSTNELFGKPFAMAGKVVGRVVNVTGVDAMTKKDKVIVGGAYAVGVAALILAMVSGSSASASAGDSGGGNWFLRRVLRVQMPAVTSSNVVAVVKPNLPPARDKSEDRPVAFGVALSGTNHLWSIDGQIVGLGDAVTVRDRQSVVVAGTDHYCVLESPPGSGQLLRVDASGYRPATPDSVGLVYRRPNPYSPPRIEPIKDDGK